MKTIFKKKEELLNEPGCSHNHKKKDKACDKPGGGESCAYDGSFIVLNPIKDAAHLIHGPIACAGNSYEGRGVLSSGSKLYKYGFTTDLSELDIVFGSEDKLEKAIRYIADNYSPAAIFVYQTCVPALTGEDVEAVCLRLKEELDLAIVPVISPGFLGHKNLGNRIAGDTLLKYVIGTGEPEEDISNIPTINMIGEYNVSGETWDIKPLFEEIGIKVLSNITGDATYKSITYAHKADLNLLVCGRALVNIARGMEEEYNIPFKEVSFYGIENTSNAIREVVKFFDIPELTERAEAYIAKKEKETREKLSEYLSILEGKKAILYTGGVKSWSYIAALKDLGITVTGIGTKKSNQSDLEKIKALVDEEVILKETNPKSILKAYEETKADFLVAGGRNQYLAYKEYIPFIDVNQEKHTPYAAYNGIIKLANDLVNTYESPIWKLAKMEAPW